jgi:hypothetical protein
MQYDVVFDGGTIEHVFNLPQVLKNIHHLLKISGRIIHASPSHNHVDHGFFMFSPTFFNDYYTANLYNIKTFYLFKYSSPQKSVWSVYEYKPGSIDAYSFGGFGKKMLGIWFIAKKTSASLDNIIPQQGGYLHIWKNNDNLQNKNNVSNKSKSAKEILKQFRILRQGVRFIRKITFSLKKLPLNKVGDF